MTLVPLKSPHRRSNNPQTNRRVSSGKSDITILVMCLVLKPGACDWPSEYPNGIRSFRSMVVSFQVKVVSFHKKVVSFHI